MGESGVGKSSIVSRFARNEYNPNFISTIGVDFRVTGTSVDGKSVKYMLWDTAGQERFAPIVTTYYRGSHAVVLVYDRTDLSTLQAAAGKWMKQVHDHARANAPVLLVGNKGDLVPPSDSTSDPDKATDSGLPTPSEVDALVEEVLHTSPFADRIFAHIVTSAKTGDNVSQIFAELAKHMLAQDSTHLEAASAKEEAEGKVDLRQSRWSGRPVQADEEPTCCKLG